MDWGFNSKKIFANEDLSRASWFVDDEDLSEMTREVPLELSYLQPSVDSVS